MQFYFYLTLEGSHIHVYSIEAMHFSAYSVTLSLCAVYDIYTDDIHVKNNLLPLES